VTDSPGESGPRPWGVRCVRQFTLLWLRAEKTVSGCGLVLSHQGESPYGQGCRLGGSREARQWLRTSAVKLVDILLKRRIRVVV